MSKKKRCLLQKLIIISIFFNFTAALSDAGDLYHKYQHMLKKFTTRPPSPDVPNNKLKNFLKNLNVYETLQLKSDHGFDLDHGLDKDVQFIKKPVENNSPEALFITQNKETPSKKIEELSALSQSSQNYGNQAVAENVNQNYATLPSQSYGFPSQSYGFPSQSSADQASQLSLNQNYDNQNLPSNLNQNYAPLSQSYANQALPNQHHGLLSQTSGNLVIPSNLNQNFPSPSQSYATAPLTNSLKNDLTKYLDYLMVNSPPMADYQNPVESSNNPSNIIDILNYNSLTNGNPRYAENAQNIMNLNTNLMEPIVQYDHGPATLIDLGNLVNQYPPDMDQGVYDINVLNGQDYVPLGILSQNGMNDQVYTPLGLMPQNSISDQDYTPLGIMPQNSINDQVYTPLGIMSQNSLKDIEYSPLGIMSQNSVKAQETSPLGIKPQKTKNQPNINSNNKKGDDIYSFFNDNPELYEKLLINGNFMTGLMNRLVMKITENSKRNHMKKFRNKVTVKRLVPKGQVMQGPVYDEKYQLLYIPLMKAPGENVEGNLPGVNSQFNKFDPKLKHHAFMLEGPNKLRQSDVYDPPAAQPETQDVLPPFKDADGPNEPTSYTQYMPQYVFTDYWTYEKPLLQDDCPDYAVNVAGVCIKYPPFRKFLQ